MSYGNDYSKKIYAKTKKYQKIYGFEIGEGKHDTWNNEADAFKHTFGAAEISLTKGGSFASKLIGDFLEWQGRKDMGQSGGEENMDKWNNAIGRKIADEIREESRHRLIKREDLDDLIAEKVIQRLRKGDLITHPSDPRKYRTPAQKFSDEIKAKYHKMQEERKRKYPVFRKGSSSAKSSSGKGRCLVGSHVTAIPCFI